MKRMQLCFPTHCVKVQFVTLTMQSDIHKDSHKGASRVIEQYKLECHKLTCN